MTGCMSIFIFFIYIITPILIVPFTLIIDYCILRILLTIITILDLMYGCILTKKIKTMQLPHFESFVDDTKNSVLKYFKNTYRMHENAQICTIFSKFSGGASSMPPDPPRGACLLRRHALVASPLDGLA